jgi:hypothetical protein
LTVLLLIISPQFTFSSTLTVGDNQPWDRYAFQSAVKLSDIYAG